MKKYFNDIICLFIKLMGYTIILMLVSLIFKNTIYLDNSDYGMWCFFAAVLISPSMYSALTLFCLMS